MQPTRVLFGLALLTMTAAVACDKQSPDTAMPATPDTPAVAATDVDDAAAPAVDVWAAALEGAHRSDDNKARDQYRHPKETLQFFGITSSSKVVELAPGGGWYTEVLAPLVGAEGQLTVSIADPAGPESYYGTRQAKAMLERKKTEAEQFGNLNAVYVDNAIELGDDGKVKGIKINAMDLGAAGSADAVLTFRSSHGLYNREAIDLVYKAAFDVLRPGGVFGVVQHRAAEGADPSVTSKMGYLPEATVIDAAKKAGFELAEKSEINANANDTKDYAKGVWTLPPSLTEKDKDREKYLAIGESDRMTLKFVKPGA
ncbi:MAG: methyltransferase [Nannocystaceae bacterium]|nr:methyltransferase [Nannocystaceae bacterium]